jgi:hypothetical protein
MMKRTGGLFVHVTALAFFLSVGIAAAEKEIEKDTEETRYTLATLTEKIDELSKKEVVLAGTIVGVCKSGCKMWVAAGEYKKGDPFALVRAKDDAFKFDTDAAGKEVVLRGFAVAKYVDYCSETGKEQEGAMDKCETPVDTKKASEKASTEKRKLEDVTFFATNVEYR